MPLVLHLGAPKCGSSALQSVLTANPRWRDRAGRRGRYGVVLPDGRIVDAAGLDATRTVTGYVASADGAALAGRKLRPAASLRRDPSETLVLSNEGWLRFAPLMPALAAGWGGDVTMVVYLRPPPDWLNSAWWQWGAWSGRGFNRWFAHDPEWAGCIEALRRHLPGARLRLRVLPRDVVADFFAEVLDAPVPGGRWRGVNRSLPGVVLRLFQRHPDLRPSEHDNALDFAVKRRLTIADPAPWVLGPGRLGSLLRRNHAENRHLLGLLDPDSAEAMRTDERWWLPRAYAGRIAESPDPQPIPRADLLRLHEDLARALGAAPAPVDAAEAEMEDRVVTLIRQIAAATGDGELRG